MRTASPIIPSAVNLEVSIAVQIKSYNLPLVCVSLHVLSPQPVPEVRWPASACVLTQSIAAAHLHRSRVSYLFIGWNQSFTRKRVNGRLCLSCDFTGFVNFNKTVFVGRSLRLQCRHHLPDLFHLFCEITYRLRQLIKCDLFVCHTYSFLIVRWQRKLVF